MQNIRDYVLSQEKAGYCIKCDRQNVYILTATHIWQVYQIITIKSIIFWTEIHHFTEVFWQIRPLVHYMNRFSKGTH